MRLLARARNGSSDSNWSLGTTDALAPAERYSLPADWQRVSLGNLGLISGGSTPSTKVPDYWDGDILWLTPNEVTRSASLFVDDTERHITNQGLANCSATMLPAGSVLMTSRATIGVVAINTVPMATNQGFINIVCDPRVVCNEFLAYWLHLHRSTLEARASGSTFREISKSSFKTIPIALPPLAEQRAIARVLRAVREAIAARRHELALERERKAALMAHLFTHGTRGEPTQQTAIGEMPQSWQVVGLGEVADVAYGLTVNERRRNAADKAPYLTVANVTRGSLRLDEVKQIGMLSGDTNQYRLQRGDVLLIEGNGNPQLLGSAAVWNDELPFALHQNHLIRARPNQAVVLSDWLMGYLNSDNGRDQLLGKAKTSSGLHSINSRLIANLSVPLPSLVEQHTIVGYMRTSDLQADALNREIALHEEFFRVLLEELMSGRLSAQPLVAAEVNPTG